MFTWLLMHDKLLTNEVRFKRHMTTSLGRPICDAAVEDIDHILQQCVNARGVWTFLRSKGLMSTQPKLEDKEMGVSKRLG